MEANFSPEVILQMDNMNDYDLFDFFGYLGYKARALKRTERGSMYIDENKKWFDGIDENDELLFEQMNCDMKCQILNDIGIQAL